MKRGLIILSFFICIISISLVSPSLCTNRGDKCASSVRGDLVFSCDVINMSYVGNRTLDFSCNSSGLIPCCKNKPTKRYYYCVNPIFGPSGPGVTKGNEKYLEPYRPVMWTFQPDSNATLKPCEWRCYKKGYVKDHFSNGCIKV